MHYMDFQVEICTKKNNIFFLQKWNRKKLSLFFWNQKTFTFFLKPTRDLLTCFMKKRRFQKKPSLFFIFILDQFHAKTGWNWRYWFQIFLASKKKLADGFIILRGIKLWNRQRSVGKQNETDGTRRREKNETDSTRLWNQTASFIQFHVKPGF